MSRTRATIIAILVLLFLASLASMWLQPSAIDVARAAAIEHGWNANEMSNAGFDWRSGALGFFQTQHVNFFVGNAQPIRTVRVKLTRAAYFLGWQVEECVEVREGQ